MTHTRVRVSCIPSSGSCQQPGSRTHRLPHGFGDFCERMNGNDGCLSFLWLTCVFTSVSLDHHDLYYA